MSQERERKPYNPYHLAGGYAAESLPDKKTIAVFKCYCSHTDFMGGSVSISLPTVMRETGYSHRAVCYADAVLTSLGRITKKPRGIGGQRGGRQSSITTVYCTAEELQKAGANDENFFGRGGKAGLFKVQTQPIQNAKRVYSKRKQDGFKVQRDALEPLNPEPFLPEPIEAEPLKVQATSTPRENPASLRTKEGKENQSQPRERQGNTIPAGKTTPVPKVPRPPRVAAFKPGVESQFRAAGAPDIWFEAMAPLTDTIDMLNGETLCGCPYPVKSWLTISLNHPNWKASQLWVPKITESGDIAYSEANSLADQIFFRRMNEKMTDAEREVNRARFWWGSLTLEQMYDTVPRDTWTTHKDGIVTASEAAILEAYRQAKGVKGTNVEAVVVEEREYVPVDDI
ncbi:MAG: hypothetical protein WB680_10305 [Candidatus Acidiferrales bacterium]